VIPTECAICGPAAPSRELYPSTLPETISPDRFSARIVPDRVHHRMVRCVACSLVRSDPILPEEEIARLYAGSAFGYADEAVFARATYGRHLRESLALAPGRTRLLEIGCGDGFFLEEALACGFQEVAGVEPSRDAVDRARPDLRERIRNDLFREGLFPPDHFDVACGFQVLDHLVKPRAALAACRTALRPGGLALFINHDIGAITHRILGERSPVIDVEHIYLYDRRTIARLFEACGFEVLRVFSVANTYPLHYWFKLAPVPTALKSRLLPWLRGAAIGRLTVELRAGNLGIVARRAP
jgi:SAM-dependent methyltransferase